MGRCSCFRRDCQANLTDFLLVSIFFCGELGSVYRLLSWQSSEGDDLCEGRETVQLGVVISSTGEIQQTTSVWASDGSAGFLC